MNHKKRQNKKIAIFHNALDTIGGAEIVVLNTAKKINADIYTTNIDHEKIKKMGFSAINIFSIGKVPINAPFRFQKILRLFHNLNLGKKYDYYLIMGDWSLSGSLHNKPNIYYTHSAIRELNDFKVLIKREMMSFWKRPLFEIWVFYINLRVKKYLRHIKKIVTNSKNVQERIKRNWNRKSDVIYPPIDTSKYFNKKYQNYWLSVNRLFPIKRIEMQIEAFKKMPEEKLIIVGSYEKSKNFLKYVDYINSIKPGNVEIFNWVDDKKVIDLYSKCKGLIVTAKNEDFGMTAIEAMASGKPVIAPNEGGYKESIVVGETGFLIDDITSQKIVDTIKKIENLEEFRDRCLNKAKEFDIDIFIENVNKLIY